MSASPPRLVHATRALSCALLAVAFTLLSWPSATASTPVDPQTAHCPPSWIPTFGGQPGVDGVINASAMFDDGNGPLLYVGGNFSHAGGVTAFCMARWNGSTWAPAPGLFNVVYALTVFDDGSGPALYAGGVFGAARWNGTTWTYLASTWNGTVYALAGFDDGQGPKLYAGGVFATADGVPANGIAKFDGFTWSAVGSGLVVGLGGIAGSRAFALAVFDDGFGDALYVGGKFTSAGTVGNLNYIAKWDGSGWSALSNGLVFAVDP